MKRIVNAANGVVFQPADADEWQDRGLALLAATKNTGLGPAAAKGADGLIWMPATGSVATATAVQLDDTLDLRDRVVWGWYVDAGAANKLPGGSNDYDFRLSVAAASFFHGYTGTGGISDLATGAAVSNGNPPLTGTGAGGRGYRVELAPATSVWLYVDPATGYLYLYNNAVGSVFPMITLFASGDAGLR